MNDNKAIPTPDDKSGQDVFSLSDSDLDKLVSEILAEVNSDRDIREAHDILSNSATPEPDIPELDIPELDITGLDIPDGQEIAKAQDTSDHPDTPDSRATIDLSIWDTDDLPDIPNLRSMESLSDQVPPAPEKPEPAPEEALQKAAPVKKTARRKAAALPEAGPKKRRPAKKAGYGFLGIPQMLTACVWIGLVLAVGISLGRVIWVCVEDVLAFNRENQEVVVTVEDGDTMEAVAAKLHDAGLIRYPKLFGWYAGLSHAEDKISSGTFTLNTIYDYHALVAAMGSYSPAREIVTITIPEGYNSFQIFRLLESNGVCSLEDLEGYAANGELEDYWFLEGVKRGTPGCLEGFLYPDTYDFYTNDDADRVINKLLSNFNTRFTDRMINDLATLNENLAEMWRSNDYGEDYIAEHAMTIQKLLTVASLVEKEAASAQEGYTIASVFYNRLTDLASYPYLNSDAALYYAFASEEDHGELTKEDLELDSPYNTYTHTGLPPTPIANPGRDSIYAALYPEDTDYYYFVYDSDIGASHFSRTLGEHEDYISNME